MFLANNLNRPNSRHNTACIIILTYFVFFWLQLLINHFSIVHEFTTYRIHQWINNYCLYSTSFLTNLYIPTIHTSQNYQWYCAQYEIFCISIQIFRCCQAIKKSGHFLFWLQILNYIQNQSFSDSTFWSNNRICLNCGPIHNNMWESTHFSSSILTLYNMRTNNS